MIRNILNFVWSLPGRVVAVSLGTGRAAVSKPRRTLIALICATAVFALAAAGFVLLSAHRTQVNVARDDASKVGQRSVATLLSYDYRSLQKDAEQRKQLLTGPFQNDYASLVDKIITPAATRDQLLTRTSVTAAGVIGNAGTERVTLLMFINQTSKSAVQPSPVLNGSRVRVTMINQGGRWLVAELTPV